MSNRSTPLVERLSQGLATAVLSAAALAVPTTEAATPGEFLLAQRQASQPAARRASSTAAKPSATQPATSTRARPAAGGKGSATAAGCGASDGGCGPSR